MSSLTLVNPCIVYLKVSLNELTDQVLRGSYLNVKKVNHHRVRKPFSFTFRFMKDLLYRNKIRNPKGTSVTISSNLSWSVCFGTCVRLSDFDWGLSLYILYLNHFL